MKQLAFLTNENLGIQGKKFQKTGYRVAVRAIALNAEGKMLLLHSKKYDYYKLAGGGIELGETDITALQREYLEETGYHYENQGEVGEVVEQLSKIGLEQLSRCYYGRIKGEPEELHREAKEIEHDFEILWLDPKTVPDLLEACIQKTRPDYWHSKFILVRDKAMVQEYLNITKA